MATNPLPIIDITPYLPSSLESTDAPAPATAAARLAVARALHSACRDVGFFYLDVSSFLSREEMDEVLQVGREFFARPQDEKEMIRLENSDGVRGYQRLHQNITQGKADHHEGLDLYAPNPYPPRARPGSSAGEGIGMHGVTDKENAPVGTKALRPLEGPNQWPEQPPRLRSTLEQWTEKMKVLGMSVMRGMCDGLGLGPEEWEEMRAIVDDSFWVMRVIGYPPLPDGMDGISCGEHKDYGCLTFLLADPCRDALQVLPRPPLASLRDNIPIPDPTSTSNSTSTPNPTSNPTSSSNPVPNPDPTATATAIAAPAPASAISSSAPLSARSAAPSRWIPADPLPGCLVVNIGEMWERWSGGLYPATLHRVVHRSPIYRVSVPFFFEPNFDARVGVLSAARRRAAEEGRDIVEIGKGGVEGTEGNGGEVVYGEFLLGKVSGNFKY